MSGVFCSSQMLDKFSSHELKMRDLKISLTWVMNKTPYSHFLLTVFTHFSLCVNSNFKFQAMKYVILYIASLGHLKPKTTTTWKSFPFFCHVRLFHNVTLLDTQSLYMIKINPSKPIHKLWTVNDVPWKDPERPLRSCKVPSGSFSVASLTVHSEFDWWT